MSQSNETPTASTTRETARAKLAKMVQEALVAPAKPAEPFDLSCPAAANPAIARCSLAYTTAHRLAASEGENKWESERAAKVAYRNAMPALSGPRNIRDFIACTAHAMLIGAINASDGARLLYAAQVAYAAHNAQPKKKDKSSAKTAPKPPENEHISPPIRNLITVE